MYIYERCVAKYKLLEIFKKYCVNIINNNIYLRTYKTIINTKPMYILKKQFKMT